jgi:hypothetical protein
MELSLNIFWLLIAMVSLVWWYRRRLILQACGQPIPRPSLQAAVLGLALTLLFPVISVSDDLHLEQAAMEDSSSSRREFKRWANSSGISNHSRAGTFCTPAAFSGLVSVYDGITLWVYTAENIPRVWLLAFSVQSRAPPFLT